MINSGYKSGAIFLNKLRDPDKYKVLLDDTEELPIVEDIVRDNEGAGVLDEDMIDMIEMLYNNDFTSNVEPTVISEEDLYVSDVDETDENTLFIPITSDIERNIESLRNDNMF